MKEIEIVDKRGPKEKHFLQENGEFRAEMYDENIHYFNNGKFEEIDNTLILEEDHYVNKANENKVLFTAVPKSELMRIEKDNHFISFSLKDYNQFDIVQEESMSKLIGKIKYINVLKNVDICYDLVSSRVKESIYIKDKDSDIDKLLFKIDTDLDLKLENDSIIAMNNDECIFKFEVPFMMDSSGELNINVEYELNEVDNSYELKTILDKEWLNSGIKYPVIIDPSITNYSNTNSVIDTYIYPNDTNVDRNSQLILKVGVDRDNNVDRVNRTLLKFDLPVIGTGSQIIDASLILNGYPTQNSTNNSYTIDVYRLTSDWQETTANWSNMNNNYDSTRIEAVCSCMQIYNYLYNARTMNASFNLTNLVKKWYTDTPNYGIMLKENNEVYRDGVIPTFYAKNPNSPTSDPKPILVVTYRNQNGLEKYMNYEKKIFQMGAIYHNNYNGNLTTVFDIGATLGSRQTADLKLIYNTNDVVLNNNYGLGVGNKFSYYQTISVATEINTENIEYLKYYDEDGTIHYFPNKKVVVSQDQNGNYNSSTTNYQNEYYDEDGLDLKIEKYDTYYLLKNKYDDKMRFNINNGIGYLSEIVGNDGSTISIEYDNNFRITKITDSSNSEIIISYLNSQVEIVSPKTTTILLLENNHILSISNNIGETIFEYNNLNLISSVTDVNGKKLCYEYYSELPYRLKKVSEKGVNNGEGSSYQITYGCKATTIIDNKNMARTIIFDDYGNPVSISNLANHNDITNAYGMKLDYDKYFEGSNIQNKLLGTQIPNKYVRNYLNNSSFESGSTDFVLSDNNSYMNITFDESCSGLASLKVQTGNYGVGGPMKSITVPKGKNYTFSAFIKALYQPLYMKLYYTDSVLGNVQEICEIIPDDETLDNNGFERYDVSIFYSENATTDLNIIFLEGDTYYIDDIQLEEGSVANSYNLLENAGFENGITGWTLNAVDSNDNDVSNNVFEIVNINNNTKALKIKMNPDYSSSEYQAFNIKGKQGDRYTISFWYKNEGFVGGTGIGVFSRNNVLFTFNPVSQQQTDLMLESTFNPNEEEWQYFSYQVEAPWDFDGMSIRFLQSLNANNLYITNLNLFRDVRSITYEYDENGNIIKSKNLNNGESAFKYDNNNQLISMTNPNGKRLVSEYDKTIKNRVLRSISSGGISNEIKYDNNGNPKSTRILGGYNYDKPYDDIFRIRAKGTNKYLGIANNSVVISNDDHNHNLWIVEKENVNNIDYYKMHHSIIQNKYLINNSNSLLFSNYDANNALYELIDNNDKSFKIRSKATLKYLKLDNNQLIFTDLITADNSFDFYFIKNSEQFIETDAVYTESGKYIKKIVDANLKTYTYNTNENTGLVESIINAKNTITYYTYNLKNQITKIQTGDICVEYEYNSNGLINKIKQDGRIYQLTYDEFLNVSSIKINGITLLTNEYEQNNGNLLYSRFSNNNSIQYIYDEFNRMSRLIKMNDTYEYIYGNNGDLLKVRSNNDIIKYVYDSAKRLYLYFFNNFKIKYGYDLNGNIISKKYKLDNISHEVTNTFNDDDLILTTNFGNDTVNYEYDDLGRIKSKNINDEIETNYKFLSNGNRSTMLIDSVADTFGTYKYTYDDLGNITHIYENDILTKKYYYDKYSELIQEDNFIENCTIRYKYDKLGNIISKKTYEIGTYNQLSQKLYQYNNVDWIDQLTSYDGTTISYDTIGNPTLIGNKVLTWINGRQLSSYSDINNTTNYTYDKDGIRISKTVNNVKTEYYNENNKIIFEKTGNNMVYYLRNKYEDLIGFKYNNDIYFYQKNIHGDITAILDSNYNIVAKYKYDSWGNIISTCDNNNIDVSNNSNHIANINPFRYRGYYFDVETGFYYLNNRYYNPEWGRFLNTDSSINEKKDIFGYNLYIYCSNNPINNTDENGQSWLGDFIVGVGKTILNVAEKTTILIGAAIALPFSPKASRSLIRSLVPNPKDVQYGKNSSVSKQAKKSKEVQQKMQTIAKQYPNAVLKDYETSIEFREDKDLYLSIQRATMYVSGELKNGSGKLNVRLEDDYDFHYLGSDSNENWLIKSINNMAWGAQEIGTISNYHITITFDYCINCK